MRKSRSIESGLNVDLWTSKTHASNTNGMGGKYVGVLLPVLSFMSCQILLVNQDTLSSYVLTQPQNLSQHSTLGDCYQPVGTDIMWNLLSNWHCSILFPWSMSCNAWNHEHLPLSLCKSVSKYLKLLEPQSPHYRGEQYLLSHVLRWVWGTHQWENICRSTWWTVQM